RTWKNSELPKCEGPEANAKIELRSRVGLILELGSRTSDLLRNSDLGIRNWRVGFTLIELMVVVVLIGVVTAMILPEMRGTFDDILLRSTGRDLVSAFGLASSQAVTVNQLHRVRLDRASGQYLVERSAHNGHE